MSLSPLLIRQFDLFKPLDDDTLQALANAASLVEVAKRQVVMEKNQHAHSLGLLLDGRLQGIDITLDGREAGLYFVEPYDFFGELAVVDKNPASEFVIALTPSKFVMIPADIARKLITQSAEVANSINQRLAQRLREAMSQRSLLTLPTPIQRVCAQLIQLTPKSAGGAPNIAFAPTHQDIAIMINTTRETVTRVFQKLQADGVIARNGQNILILNLEYLQKVATGEIEVKK